MALEAGAKVVAGTDEGGWEHGNNAHEILCLAEAGMTPMQAIIAATGHAAQCIGLDKEIGTIEGGKNADLVLVDGDPSRDVSDPRATQGREAGDEGRRYPQERARGVLSSTAAGADARKIGHHNPRRRVP